MTHKAALAGSEPIVLEKELSGCSGLYNTNIKIYKVGIIYGATIHIADPVWIVTGIAGGLFSYNMPVMNLLLDSLTRICIVLGAGMAGVAQFIGES